MKRLFILTTVAAALTMSAGLTLAADQDQVRDQDRIQDQDRLQTQERDQIYGSQIMTQQERLEYRNRMREATSAEERERIRKEHHEQMKERARKQGVTLPDEPPAMRGPMMEPGSMRPDGGMGGKGR